ncbi:SRPBCC family protein [Pedobacter heparinus]|uniref:SRPBCC family protein n=1 Tax=Pedobacter heparinus TaxID=984 RepID=UPI00292EBA76|nr:SRPBCC family protein [Pedobacter heparinus]
MNKGLIAKTTIDILVPITKVWDALVTPETIKKYMFGTEVISDWEKGGPITWNGVWKDKPYQDKGTILKIEPPKLLQYTHYSPLSGEKDILENYHTLTYELADMGGHTRVSLSQDNNADEEAKQHSLKMWEAMLEELKKALE